MISIKDDILFADKPAGVTTHQSHAQFPGFVEYLQHQIGTKLYVVHRLDRETTGAMCFALSKSRAQDLFEKFKNRSVKKSYLFLTKSSSTASQFTATDPIEHSPAETVFTRIKRNAFCELWKAQPTSGKRHQIRIHASLHSIPILGDQQYQGAPYPHLCLHSASLQIPGYELWESPEPLFFKRMGLAFHKDLVFLLSAADRRQRLFDFLSNKKTCYRLFHFESGWDLAIDKLGERLFFWGNKSLNDFTIEAYCDSLGLAPLFRERQNRGKQTGSQLVESQTWMAQENDLNYVLKSHVGFSQGIFLDQRANRALIKKLSKNKTVLNLFCYTGGFSVAAAKGLATQVLSVDTSATYLNWAKENFQSNQLKNAEWIQQDSLLFLKGAAKRQQKYDLIIIDPPSFSRGTKKIKPFKIEKDYKSLLDLSFKVLAPNGKIFFSTNFEKWSLEEFKKRVLSVCPQRCNFDWLAHEWDFELPPFEPKMKSVLISTQS